MSDEHKVNPAWVSAPYRVSYCFAVPRGLRRNWSRKRWLRHKRRLMKKYLAMVRPPPAVPFNQIDWQGDVSFTKNIGCSASDIGG